MATTLPVSRLISVGVNLSPKAAQAQNLSSLLILGPSSVIDIKTRMRSYGTIDAVAIDFGTLAPEYQAAQLWFDQAPQPTQVLIGRWAQAASSGQLIGAALAAGILATLQGIANGGLTMTIDALAPQVLAGLNFAGAANLNAVAAIIDAALANATVLYNSQLNRFEVMSATTGATSIVSFATAAAGTDLSHLLGLALADGGYQSNGIVAESALSAVTLFDSKFGQQWYALTILGAATADHLVVAGYVEASATYHFYGVTTQDQGVLVPTTTTDVASQLKVLDFNKTAVQYSSLNPYAVCSLLARILTTDYTGNNTVITLMYKQEPGIGSENLDQTQIGSVEAKNCNVFVAYNNSTAIIEPGVTSSGLFIDEITGAAAFAVALQTAGYNLLFLSPTKIQQTDGGMHVIATTMEQVCAQFVTNGFLAPGDWDAAGFGTIQQGDFLPKGYYIFTPSISTQSQASRGARLSVPIQIAGNLAGAVHKVNLGVTINA
jgi:hypothetical protein